VPYLDEPWYCCAEPMDDQFVSIGKSKARYKRVIKSNALRRADAIFISS